MKVYIKLFVCALALMCFCSETHAQRGKIRPGKVRTKDLSTIVGYCGCTECDGELEHNNPMDEFAGFILGNRWSSTAMNGGGLGQGSPTTLTWSIVPDGTDANGGAGFVPSNMIAVFDNLFNEANAGTADLTNRFWHGLMVQSFDRWGELSGLDYVYEPNDDGATNFGAGGVVGVRGDVRIGGFNIDGGGGTLAFNTFPNNGDMACDTADLGSFGSAGANFRIFRNIIMHEHGHGLGFNHVDSNNSAFLMEPFIQGSFDGPQLDDIRAVHRQYGDFFEKANNGQGNNSIANAIDLGTLEDGQNLSLGTDGASGTFVAGNDTDFVSVDDNGDQDFYRISVNELGFLDVTLTPVGASYNQSAQGQGGNNPTNPSSSSNLTLTLLDSGGGFIALLDNTGAGSQELLVDQFVTAGDYFIRVTGSANTIQLYTLLASFETLQLPVSTAPLSVSVDPGTVAAGGVADLEIADNQRFELQPTIPAAAADAPITALFTVISPDILPSSFFCVVRRFRQYAEPGSNDFGFQP